MYKTSNIHCIRWLSILSLAFPSCPLNKCTWPFEILGWQLPSSNGTFVKYFKRKIYLSVEIHFFFRYFKDLQVKKSSKWFFKGFFLSIICNQWCYLHWMFLVKAILQSRWVDCKKKRQCTNRSLNPMWSSPLLKTTLM